MSKLSRSFLYLLTIVAVLFMSAMPTYTVLADGGDSADPPSEDPLLTTPTDPPAENPEQTSVSTDAPPHDEVLSSSLRSK